MLHIHRSERADYLVEGLAELLATPPDDPMSVEVVSVPTRGVERWLTQRLSHHLGTGPVGADGVCANVDFPFPGSLIGSATARACGFEPDDDPWPPERSVWPLIEIVDANLGEPWLAELAGHLREAGSRRFAAVRHIADLYDRYAVHRPEMVRAWLAGEGAGGWQAELWRHLRERLGVPSPAERFHTASERLAREPEVADLPGRLSLFGLTRLPASHLDVLRALAVARDVHLFLLHPSGILWQRMADALSAGGAATAVNPLLRSWGRDAREMQIVLAGGDADAGRAPRVVEDHRPVPAVPPGAGTLLGRIQADIRADRVPAGADGLDPADDSLRIHACHGRARQVEVIRDAVLHLLAADPTLETRDVIVMCPDIEAFAPLVHAAFGVGEEAVADRAADPAPAGAGSGPPALRVRLADRSLRQTNPLLAVTAQLLELAAERVRASEVLDLCAREPVARRFGFDEEDLAQLERWAVGTGIRWGLDGRHRAPWSLSDLDANTWRAGLDRLLLGVAMGEDDQRLFGQVLPHDDVSSGGVELAGRFAEMIDRLESALDALQGARPVTEWVAALMSATDSLALAAEDAEWQHEQLHRVLRDAAGESGSSGAASGRVVLDRSEVAALLADRLKGRPTRANFRTGDLTICTLVPMRSVPHRVVCLLGLDDGAFPRHAEQDGDDLLLAEPRIGDRDPRREDRQLLLDAVLAARERLVITYEGRDQRTNHERPPAVPVAELLDVVDRTARHWDDNRRARDAVVVHHPLQSFDPRNFLAGRLGTDAAWSFDPVNLEGARALCDPHRRGPRPFLPAPLPPLGRQVIQLDALIRFSEHPTRAFLRERLGLYISDGPGEVRDALPVELDPLERWGVGQRLLDARLAGVDADRALAAEQGRGLLPPGGLATGVLTEVCPTVDALIAQVDALPDGGADPESYEVNLRLPDGRSLIGTVPGVRDGTILRCVFSRLAPKHRVAAWVRFLALSAALPDRSWSSVTMGRGQAPMRRGPSTAVSRLELTGSPAERARIALEALGGLVDLYDRGMCEPLPIYCETSAAWATARLAGDHDAVEAARRAWQSDPDSPVPGEDVDVDHKQVLGGVVSFDRIRTEDFDRLALSLWRPLLEREQ